MIQANIFRPPRKRPKPQLSFTETRFFQEQEEDPFWPQIEATYQFFMELVLSNQITVRAIKVFVTPNFVERFLELFNSEDYDERDYLKRILHRLYAKVSIFL